VLPTPSIWPFALTLASFNLVFGLWFLALGGGPALVAAGGRQAAVNREQRHGCLDR
jgi:hypothetical protein